MKLRFYKTGFKPEQNGVYESIGDYLSTLTPILTYSDFKFINPALTTNIKLDLSGKQFDKKNIGDFVVAEDGSDVWYYFVMNVRWRAKQTALVELGLDTLNTFWNDLKDNFTEQTHITRQFKNRYFVSSSSATMVPVVDKQAESITVPPQIRKSVNAYNNNQWYDDWYLIYKTQYSNTSELNENPVDVLALCSVETKIKTTAVGDVVYTIADMQDDSWLVLSDNSTATDGTVTMTSDETTMLYIGRPRDANYLLFVWIIHTDNADGKIWYRTGQTQSVTISKGKIVYIQSSSCPTIAETSGSAKQMTYQDFTVKVTNNLTFDNPRTIDAGLTIASIPSFEEWYETGCTDSTVVKILQLPYPPFTALKDSSGNLILPDGWEASVNGLILTDKATDFKCNLGYKADRGLPINFTKDNVDVSADYDLAFETKLYNSTYRTSKYVYDAESWVEKPENFNTSTITSAMNVDFSLSTSMDSSLMFTFRTAGEQESDFGEYLISTRSLEVPYFTNEYLNYLRYGKAVDERNKALSAASAVTGAVGTGLSLASSAALGFSNAAFGWAGVAIGAVTLAVSLTSSIMKANDTINSKIDQYEHQASKVNSTSDISIFKQYGKNRLLNIIYEPVDELKESIGNYFRLYGYSTDSYSIPQLSTRYWTDYLVLTPSFKDGLIWNEFKDDIAARMGMGFRVYHWHDVYDLNCEKENWESEVVEWAAKS